MIAVYIASPYTQGDPVVNVRQSLLAADELAVMGYLPFAPLLSHFWNLMSLHPHNFWMKMDLDWLKRCDCLLRLPGASAGADLEVKFAFENHIPILFSVEELLEKFPVNKE